MFSKHHFPGFSFTYNMFFQGVCVFVSMNVCVFVCVVRHVFLYVCIEGKLEDLARETNLEVQSNVISMLKLRLVTTPSPG
jgi:hypothetical protein